MNKIIILGTILICCICSQLFALYPRAVVGFNVQGLLYPGDDQILNTSLALAADALLSFRTLVFEDSYLSLLAEVEAGVIPNREILYLDEELLFAEAGFSIGQGRLVCTAEYNSSIEGTHTDMSFYSAEWKLQYLFLTELGKLNPYVAYNGYILFEPESSLDVFVHEGKAGFEYNPSIQNGYELSASFIWEEWFDYPLYTTGGTESGNTRYDYLAMCSAKAFGIIDLFLAWELVLDVSMRWSNANRYIEAVTYLNETSEDRLAIEIEASLEWSPSSHVNIQLKPKFGFESYFYREALSLTDNLLGETAYIVSAGGIFHIDWTPDNTIYVIAEVNGFGDFSNDDELNTWQCILNLSVQYSFNF